MLRTKWYLIPLGTNYIADNTPCHELHRIRSFVAANQQTTRQPSRYHPLTRSIGAKGWDVAYSFGMGPTASSGNSGARPMINRIANLTKTTFARRALMVFVFVFIQLEFKQFQYLLLKRWLKPLDPQGIHQIFASQIHTHVILENIKPQHASPTYPDKHLLSCCLIAEIG